MKSEERRLLDRFQTGDTSVFRDIVETHKKRVYYLCLDLLGNHHDAEDLSQDVFIKAYNGLKSFRGDASIGSWLHRVTVNAFINKKRKKAYQLMTLREDMNEAPGTEIKVTAASHPEKQGESAVIQKHIEKALEQLAPKERAVFVLRHYEDLPLKEIAATLKIAEGTVKSLLFRAVRRLQKELAFYRQDLGLKETG